MLSSVAGALSNSRTVALKYRKQQRKQLAFQMVAMNGVSSSSKFIIGYNFFKNLVYNTISVPIKDFN